MSRVQLIEAIQVGDRELVGELLASDPTLASERDEGGVRLVLMALYHGRRELAETIASYRNALDLFEACALGRSSRFNEILDRDADASDSFSPDGFPLIGYAAFFGQVDLLRRLVDSGADVNVEARNPTQVRPIHSAVAYRDPDTALQMTRILLEAGADPNASQHGGYTALQSAAVHGNRPLVDLLLECGADGGQASDDGRSPAVMAREGGHEELATYLERSIS